jgi:hypothetical protein
MAIHLISVGYRDLAAAGRKIECLEGQLRRSADWKIPGRRVQFTLQAPTIEDAIDLVDSAIEECDEAEDLMREDPQR